MTKSLALDVHLPPGESVPKFNSEWFPESLPVRLSAGHAYGSDIVRVEVSGFLERNILVQHTSRVKNEIKYISAPADDRSG